MNKLTQFATGLALSSAVTGCIPERPKVPSTRIEPVAVTQEAHRIAQSVGDLLNTFMVTCALSMPANRNLYAECEKADDLNVTCSAVGFHGTDSKEQPGKDAMRAIDTNPNVLAEIAQKRTARINSQGAKDTSKWRCVNGSIGGATQAGMAIPGISFQLPDNIECHTDFEGVLQCNKEVVEYR